MDSNLSSNSCRSDVRLTSAKPDSAVGQSMFSVSFRAFICFHVKSDTVSNDLATTVPDNIKTLCLLPLQARVALEPASSEQHV
jgi:hypothetical protein